MTRLPRHLLSERVQVMRRTDDPYGGSWSESSEPRARVNHTQRMVRDANGNEVVSGATVYFDGGADVEATDRLVIDGVRADADPPGRGVLTLARRRDRLGRVNHLEVSVE